MKGDKIMKKIVASILAVSLVVGGSVAYAWGNQTWWDTTYRFNRCQIAMPDGSCLSGEVKEWLDFEDSDMIQVKMKDGTVYYTHSSNVVLIAD